MIKNKIFFEPKDLLKIPDFESLPSSSMYRKYNQIRDTFDKTKDQKVTYSEVAEFLGIPEEMLRKTIQSFYNIPT